MYFVRSCSIISRLSTLAPSLGAATTTSPPSIKVQVNEVIVPVKVRRKGKLETDLDKEDFRIYISKAKSMQIRFFHSERRPAGGGGILIDLSKTPAGCIGKTIRKRRSAGQKSDPRRQSQIQGYLIGYSNEAELLVKTKHRSEPRQSCKS